MSTCAIVCIIMVCTKWTKLLFDHKQITCTRSYDEGSGGYLSRITSEPSKNMRLGKYISVELPPSKIGKRANTKHKSVNKTYHYKVSGWNDKDF